MTRKRIRTAAIVVIGNEILTGKVRDRNSFYLAGELRALGVSVLRISVVPDEVRIIGAEVVSCSEAFDHVFTTGGIGPTHDDVTMAAIASGFGVKLVRHPVIRNAFEEKYTEPLNAAVMKMTEVPEGAGIIADDTTVFPVVSFRNVFIFPGIPEYLQQKFPLIRDRLRSGVFYLKKIYLNTHESGIADSLNRVVERNPDVSFGSYPVIGNSGYKVMITVESTSERSLQTAFDDLMGRLSPTDILRTE